MSFAGLPFELLARICCINAYADERGYSALRIPGPLRDTISASQVCHRWRSGIIAAPELWRVLIDPHHPCASWRDLLLKRSEPLSIEFMDSFFASKDGQHFYDTHLEMQSGMHMRLRKYKFQPYCGAGTIPNYASAWPSEPDSWPQLQHLCLHLNTDPFDYHPDSNSDWFCLPNHLPGLATPVLERLDLAYCYMPDWYGLRSIGQTLTNLRIFRPRSPSRLCPNRWIKIIQDLPHLETLHLSHAMESHCNHSGSTNCLTLGVKEFVLEDTVHACASFLNQINLSSKCCSSEIVCFREPARHEGDNVKPVLFHVKRLLSQTVIDSPHLIILHNFVHIQSGPLGPPSLWHEESLPIITRYSNFFSLIFNLSHAVTKDSVFPGLLDLARPLSSTIEIIESRHTGFLLPDAWDLLFEFLTQCQNVRFMLGVTGPWWERLCRYLSPAANVATTESLFPKLRIIDFERRVWVRRGPEWAYIIPPDDLKAFCKHRARIGMPLERIDMYQGILEIDSSGTIEAEPASWDWTSEEGRRGGGGGGRRGGSALKVNTTDKISSYVTSCDSTHNYMTRLPI